jgi:hypothetical protein
MAFLDLDSPLSSKLLFSVIVIVFVTSIPRICTKSGSAFQRTVKIPFPLKIARVAFAASNLNIVDPEVFA